jgi:hypothetical protein
VVSDNEEEADDEAYFLEQKFSGLYDQTIWDCIECYLNFPESETPEENPLSYAHIRLYSKSIQIAIFMTV